MEKEENRKKERTIRLRVSEEEYQKIRKKMEENDIKNFSLFAREMLINGEVVIRDFSEIQRLNINIVGIAKNINQIAKVVNATQSIYSEEVSELQEKMNEALPQIKERLSKMKRKG